MTNNLSLTITLSNVASTQSGNDIQTVDDPSENFVLVIQLSDVNMEYQADGLGLTQYTLQATDPDSRAGIAAGDDLTVTGWVDVFVPAGDCTSVTYMCVFLSEGDGASHIDVNLANNNACLNVSSIKMCDPGRER